MELKTSQALSLFKKEAGQINHMLITLYVGLDGIIPYDLSPNPSIHTTWNPKSKQASVERSRIFARKATIAWLVNCVDMYFQTINQAPLLFLPDNIKFIFDGEEYSHSIYKRVNHINSYLTFSTIDTSFVDLLICWRNRIVHHGAKNDIVPANRQLLVENKDSIFKDFCGLDITKVLEHFDNNSVPTFKEVTSLVHATTNYIYQLDERLIKKLDLQRYADRIIINYIREGQLKPIDKTNPRINNIFSKESSARLRIIKQILKQNGFSDVESENNVDEFCKTISQLNYQAALTHFKNGSFLTE